jgi:hypothetical protein
LVSSAHFIEAVETVARTAHLASAGPAFSSFMMEFLVGHETVLRAAFGGSTHDDWLWKYAAGRQDQNRKSFGGSKRAIAWLKTHHPFRPATQGRRSKHEGRN